MTSVLCVNSGRKQCQCHAWHTFSAGFVLQYLVVYLSIFILLHTYIYCVSERNIVLFTTFIIQFNVLTFIFLVQIHSTIYKKL